MVLYVIIYQSTHYKETIVCMIIHCWYCIGLTKSSFGFFQTILWKNLNNFLVNSIYFMGFWQLIHIHHYGIIQSIFIALKLLYALPIYHPTPFLMTFYKVNNPCNQHPGQKTKHYHYPKDFLCALFSSPRCKCSLDFCQHRLVLLGFLLYVRAII